MALSKGDFYYHIAGALDVEIVRATAQTVTFKARDGDREGEMPREQFLAAYAPGAANLPSVPGRMPPELGG